MIGQRKLFAKQRNSAGEHPGGPAATSRAADDLLARANLARDTKQWAAASALYGQYLELVPDDAPIWVQRGNCAKDAGEYASAHEAYGHALQLSAGSADLHLQIGHLFKLTGNLNSALDSYRKAMELDPDDADAKHEVAGLSAIMHDAPFLLPQSLFPGKTFTSIEDLLEFLRTEGTSYDPFERYSQLLR